MAEEKKPQVDVKQAVKAALAFVREVYESEKITNVGLEEVAYDDEVWRVTVGFSRPWDYPKRSLLDEIGGLSPSQPSSEPRTRDYKAVKVDASSGQILGMEIREA
jgi:hypothetical protein